MCDVPRLIFDDESSHFAWRQRRRGLGVWVSPGEQGASPGFVALEVEVSKGFFVFAYGVCA